MTLNCNLQALRASGSNLTNAESMLSAQNRLGNSASTRTRSPRSSPGAAKGNAGALKDLTRAGINTNSVLQSLKDKTTVSTQRSGEEESGYQPGLG